MENQRALVSFINKVRLLFPNKTIWMYSGYLFDTEIHNPNGKVHCEVTDEILNNIDVLVDGKFVEELKNLSLKFRGSTNQRIIMVQESNFRIMAEKLAETREKLERIMAEATGQPLQKVHEDCDRDNYMTAEEALEYGLIDKIIQPAKK